MNKKLAAIYVRVSSQQQKEDETINSQIDILQQFAKENGYEVSEDLIFQDNGYSGSSLDRPALDSLRDLSRDCPLNAVLVYSPDRLSRKYALQLILEEEFRKIGVKIIFFKGRSQNNTPEDYLLAHFQGIFAEYERAQILDRTRRGKLYKARQGDLSILSQAPLGYSNERGQSFYTIKKDEIMIVKEIFFLFTREKLSMREIAKRLEIKGFCAPKGGLKWDSKTISGILGNPAYMGTAYYGKTEKYEGNIERTVRYKKRGKVTKPLKPKRKRPKEHWLPLSVPQIISESDFETAQELLKNNKQFASRNTKEPSIFQGLLVCGLCGCSYYKKLRGKNAAQYMCRSHLEKNLQKCGNRSLKQLDVDNLIWDNLIELLKNPRLIEQEIDRRYNENTEKDNEGIHKKILEKELKQIEKSHNKLLDAYQEGDCLTLEELRIRSKSLKDKEKTLRTELKALEARAIKEGNFENITKTLEMFRDKLDKSFESLCVKDKQRVARMLIEDVVIFPEEIEIRHTIPVFEARISPLCGASVQTSSGLTKSLS